MEPRLDYARICVEVDANMPYVQQFEIECPLSENPIRLVLNMNGSPHGVRNARSMAIHALNQKFRVVQHPGPTRPSPSN
ncbi:hypothetical protein OIU78_002767 [Salix suchowensis]|nr:hypothetical protein OIU78_002767 [Salix suchowensis]